MKKECLLIGLGDIGVGYDLNSNSENCLTHARAIQQNDYFELIGGVDICEEKRTIFEKEYKVKSFSNIEESLENHSPDIVIIATPTEYHYKNFCEVVNFTQPNAIICEKPISYNLNEALEIRDIANKKKIKVFTNYFRISDPAVNLINNNKSYYFSGPAKGVVWYSKGLLHNGSHFVNLMQFWFGKILGYKILSHNFDGNIETYEADFILNFNNADIHFISAWEKYYSHYTFEILSKYGRLECDINGKITWNNVIKDKNFDGYKILNDEDELINSSMSKYQTHVFQNIQNYFNGNENNLCTIDMAIESLQIIEKIFTDSKDD